MRLEKLSALAELVSSVAIVMTLAYLAVQTQQTNSALFSNSRAALMSSDITLLTTWASDPELALLSDGGNPKEMTAAQLAQQQMLTVALFRVREYAWFQHQNGLLDDQAWNGYLTPLVRMIREEEMQQRFWQQFSPELDEDFVRFVNERANAP